MTDEDESAVDDNNISATCNICRQTFNNKADMNVHVKSAHFGMKDNKDSLVVVNLDDEPEEETTSDSDDGMTLDSDSVCGVCFSIFKDSTDLESHIKLAHDKNIISESQSVISKDDVVEKAAIILDSNLSSERAETKLPEPDVAEPDERREVHNNTNKVDNKSNDCVSRDSDVFEYRGDDSSDNECQQILNKSDNDGNKNVLQIDDQKDTVIIDDADDATTDSIVNKNYERVICNICVKEFESKDVLTLHIRSDHFGISSYKCAMCSLSFENRNQVIKHYNECTGTPVEEKSRLPVKAHSRVSEKLAVKVNAKAKKAKRLSKKYLMNKIGSAKKEKKKKKPARELRRSSTRIAELNSRKASENSRRSRPPISRKTPAKNKHNKTAPKKSSKLEQGLEPPEMNYTRPCFICGEKYLSPSKINEHMLKNHCDYGKLTASDLSVFKHLKPNEKFKCLRCGKVGLLHVIQQHLQEKCVRAPFQGTTVPKSYFCSVCGEHFSDAKTHDFHVASVHYSHLFNPDFKHFGSIPYPHVLLYHISPDVCQHCGQTCQNTVKWSRFPVQPKVQCIKGPYVCPYPHSGKQSMCTLDLLLHHVKFCRYKSGVLALQCNNCFKMLLCNNSPKQIDQLKEVIKMPQLECCQNNQKSFKCYCCTRDYTWSVITEQLKASIKRLDSIRSNSKVCGTVHQNKILRSNPSIHTKYPQFKRFSHAPIDLDQEESLKRAVVQDISLERKRRATSFDRVQHNLAQIKKDNSRVFEYSDHHNDKNSTGKSEVHENAVENEANKKDVIHQPTDAIRIQNTFSKPLERISSQVSTNQTMTNPVADDVPALRNVRTYTDTDHMEHRQKQLKSGVKRGLFSRASTEPPGYIIEEEELIPETKENVDNLKQMKPERLINNLSKADKKSKHFKPSAEETLGTKFEKDCSRETLKDPSPKILSGLTTCSICASQSPAAKRVFFDSKSIVRHMAEHKEQQQKLMCYDCHSSFDNRSLWKQHITAEHPQCLILECDYKDCTMEFQRPQDLQKHIFSEHCHMFGCAECLAQFSTEQELISHTDATHVQA